jgi:fructokinase
MPRIFTFGETVYDIIFKDAKPIAAKAGGSALNTSVSLGRLGLDVNFVSDLGKDNIGDTIIGFLSENGVKVNFIERYVNRKTSIAIAFLDDNNDASYTFYKDFPEERLSKLNLDFKADDIVLFGSFFALTENLRPVLRKFLKLAQDAHCIIIYDPNFRKAHLHELDKLKPFILENISFADIVRGSDEDFKLIFGVDNAEDTFMILKNAGCGNLIYTANQNDVIMKTQHNSVNAVVPLIKAVSTIGAGDNFNAGLIWTLAQNKLSKKEIQHLPEITMEKIISNGIAFAAEVCMSYENYVSRGFADNCKKNR